MEILILMTFTGNFVFMTGFIYAFQFTAFYLHSSYSNSNSRQKNLRHVLGHTHNDTSTWTLRPLWYFRTLRTGLPEDPSDFLLCHLHCLHDIGRSLNSAGVKLLKGLFRCCHVSSSSPAALRNRGVAEVSATPKHKVPENPHPHDCIPTLPPHIYTYRTPSNKHTMNTKITQ